MTCIVGLVHEGRVLIGGDSAGVAGLDLTVRADRKVFRNGDFTFGFTTSFRMGQLLRHSFVPPRRYPGADIEKFMVVDFIDAVRSCLKAGAFSTTRDGAEIGGTFLVGHAGHLFTVHSDYQVAQQADGFDAVGCGESFARGALYANAHLEPASRVEQALRCAESFSAGVRGPFHIETLQP